MAECPRRLRPPDRWWGRVDAQRQSRRAAGVHRAETVASCVGGPPKGFLRPLGLEAITEPAQPRDNRWYRGLFRAAFLFCQKRRMTRHIRIDLAAMGFSIGEHGLNFIHGECGKVCHDVCGAHSLARACHNVFEPDAMPLEADLIWREKFKILRRYILPHTTF